jgi:hypothetical protein
LRAQEITRLFTGAYPASRKSQLAISKRNTDASSLLKSSVRYAWPRFTCSWPDATLEKPIKPGVMRSMPARRDAFGSYYFVFKEQRASQQLD